MTLTFDDPERQSAGAKARDRLKAAESLQDWIAETNGATAQEKWLIAHLSRLRRVLDKGFEGNNDFFPLLFAAPRAPTVSVIIPVHNYYAATFHCLCSLLYARNEISNEVIVVDDGSSDETAERLAEHEGLRVVSHEEAGGFIEACNHAAAEARGHYLTFLNNDTETTAGWLDELVRAFNLFPATGAAASKLLFPDGTIQDAGGLVWNTGRPANFGRRQNAADPRFCYSRDTDYLSGAALMTPASVWKTIGGFEEGLKPAYFEDTWYSFAVRELGLRTIYCATSRVYHVQGLTNGVEANADSGIKRYVNINLPKFQRRWAQAYSRHGAEHEATDLQKDRIAVGRALFIGWNIPRPDKADADAALLLQMRALQHLGFKITFAPANAGFLSGYTEDLQRIGIECVYAPFMGSIRGFLSERGGEFDLVWSTADVFEPLATVLRRDAPNARLLLDTSSLTDDQEVSASGPSIVENIPTLLQSDVVIASRDEINRMRQVVTQGHPIVQERPSGLVDRTKWPGMDDRDGVSMITAVDYQIDIESFSLIAKQALPSLPEAERPSLHLYGTGWEIACADATPRVEWHAADESPPRLENHLALLEPGAGSRESARNVAAAIAAGTLCLLSAETACRLGLVDGEDCVVVSDREEWGRALAELRKDPQRWENIRVKAAARMETERPWWAASQHLEALF